MILSDSLATPRMHCPLVIVTVQEHSLLTVRW